MNRQQPRKGSPAFKEWPQARDETPCAAFLQARAHSSGDARLLLFLLLLAPGLAPSTADFFSTFCCLPTSLSLWLHWARLAPCLWFHSLEAGLAGPESAPPAPQQARGPSSDRITQRTTRRLSWAPPTVPRVLFVSLPSSIRSLLVSLASIPPKIIAVAPTRSGGLRVAPLWSGDHQHQCPREGKAL